MIDEAATAANTVANRDMPITSLRVNFGWDRTRLHADATAQRIVPILAPTGRRRNGALLGSSDRRPGKKLLVDKKGKISDMVAHSPAQPTHRRPVTEGYHFLLDQVPLNLRSLIPSTLKTAYAAAEVLIESEPILKVPSAEDNRGRIISWAIDLGFVKLLQSAQWPFDYRWGTFSRPTGRFLEIILSHSLLTISQTPVANQQPRDVHFRANKRLNNQGFLDFVEFRREREVCGLPHILLIHGYQTLTFAHLGIPNEIHSYGYIYRTPNLMRMPHAVLRPEPPPEETDVEAVMTLKDEIDKWRRDHDKK
jgi:hypothetical protein